GVTGTFNVTLVVPLDHTRLSVSETVMQRLEQRSRPNLRNNVGDSHRWLSFLGLTLNAEKVIQATLDASGSDFIWTNALQIRLRQLRLMSLSPTSRRLKHRSSAALRGEVRLRLKKPFDGG